MSETDPARRPTEVHVGDWTIVQVAGDLDTPGAAQLRAEVEPLLTAGAKVALDLRRVRVDPDTAPEAVRALAAMAVGVGAELVTVESDEQTREMLRDAGVPTVFESLDAALHVTTPTLREAGAPSPEPPLVPASGDAILVETEDSMGSGRSPS
jgi:anti-anti-sigma regulatory factor